MGKKYQRSKLAETTGVGKETLRYYESRNIVSPSREPGNGYRTYTDEDLANLIKLKIKRSYGYSLEEAAGNIPGFAEPEWEQHLKIREAEIDFEIKKLERIKQIYADQRWISQKARNEYMFLLFEELNDTMFYLKQMVDEDVCSDKKTDYAVKEIIAAGPMAFYGMTVNLSYLEKHSIKSSNGYEEYGCFWLKRDEELLPKTDMTGLEYSAYPISTICRTVIAHTGNDEQYYDEQERIFCAITEKGYRVSSDIIYRILPDSVNSSTYYFEMLIPVEKV